MHEDDLIGNEMPVQLDLGAGREVFIPHHEVRRPTIPAIDLENEGALPSGSAHAALSFVELQYEPRARLDGAVHGLGGCWVVSCAAYRTDKDHQRRDRSTSKLE